MIYRYPYLLSFRPPEYASDLMENFGRTKYFTVYAAKVYSITLGLLGMLQPPFFKPFPKFLNYNKHRNTYAYIVMFRGIIDRIMETCRKSMKLMKWNTIMIILKWCASNITLNSLNKIKFNLKDILLKNWCSISDIVRKMSQ